MLKWGEIVPLHSQSGLSLLDNIFYQSHQACVSNKIQSKNQNVSHVLISLVNWIFSSTSTDKERMLMFIKDVL